MTDPQALTGADIFNRLSFRNDPHLNQHRNIPRGEAEQRAGMFLETISPLAGQELVFAQADGTWTSENLGDRNRENNTSYLAMTGDTMVEVVDLPPHHATHDDSNANLTHSTERLVGIYDVNKGPGTKGTVWIRMNANHAPEAFISMGSSRNDGLAPRFSDGCPDTQRAMGIIEELVQQINGKLPAPPWLPNFDPVVVKGRFVDFVPKTGAKGAAP